MRRASVFLLTLLLLGHTAAQTDPDLERIRGDIAKLRQKLEDVRTQTQSAERQLEEVGIELDIRTRELEIATRIEAGLEQQQHALENQVALIAGRIAEQKDFLRHRLGALYRLGRLSYARLLLSIDPARRDDPLQAVSMLTYLASRDARAIARFEADRRQLGEQQAALAIKQRSVIEARKIVQQRQEAVAAMHARQERLVAQLHHQSEQSEQQIASLEEKAKRLERLIDLLVGQDHDPVGHFHSRRARARQRHRLRAGRRNADRLVEPDHRGRCSPPSAAHSRIFFAR